MWWWWDGHISPHNLSLPAEPLTSAGCSCRAECCWASQKDSNFIFFYSCRSTMSEFTPAIMSMSLEDNLIWYINVTKMYLSHQLLKQIDRFVLYLKNKCVFHKSKTPCSALSYSSLCSWTDHFKKKISLLSSDFFQLRGFLKCLFQNNRISRNKS